MKVNPEDSIAIIGMACRVPGAGSPEELWEMLIQGFCPRTKFGPEYIASWASDPRQTHVNSAPKLSDVDKFDAKFFGINNREAQAMDPQHRLLLEVAYHALEDAGYSCTASTKNIGVFVSAGLPTYLLEMVRRHPEISGRAEFYSTVLSNDKDFLAGRLSNRLNLKGPSMAIQTACSSSLVAVHQAVRALRCGECDLAIVGGVSINSMRVGGGAFHEGGIVSPDGSCRPFQSSTMGTVFGDGLGAVVLRPAEMAIRSRDHIYATIAGGAVNNDGGGKMAFSAPSVDGQRAVIAEALRDAKMSPDRVGLVEGHGTGTPLGDRIEVSALNSVYGTLGPLHCTIGSIKENIGHLDVAAGMLGLIKATLCVAKGMTVPTPSLCDLSDTALVGTPFVLRSCAQTWPSDRPRVAAVSSFGMGGANAHVLIEEHRAVKPAMREAGGNREAYSIPVSSHTKELLSLQMADLLYWLKRHPDTRLLDLAYSMGVGRKAGSVRRIINCRSIPEAIEAIERGSGSENDVAANNVGDIHMRLAQPPLGFARCSNDRVNCHVWQEIFNVGLGDLAGIQHPLVTRVIDDAAEIVNAFEVLQKVRAANVLARTLLCSGIYGLAAFAWLGVLSVAEAIWLATIKNLSTANGNKWRVDTYKTQLASKRKTLVGALIEINWPCGKYVSFVRHSEGTPDAQERVESLSWDLGSVTPVAICNVFDEYRSKIALGLSSGGCDCAMTWINRPNEFASWGFIEDGQKEPIVNDLILDLLSFSISRVRSETKIGSPELAQPGIQSMLAELWEFGVDLDWRCFRDWSEASRVCVPQRRFRRDGYWCDGIMPPFEVSPAEAVGFGAFAEIYSAASPATAEKDAFVRRTRKSKEYFDESRVHHADPRNVIGYDPEYSDLAYPVVATHARGAYFWDLDGNKFVDLCMGFGSNLFGHSPQFLTTAISEQLQRGYCIGPQCAQADNVARAICEATGMERAAFTNSGTEAVMTSIRMARAFTGRSKIVTFSGSYHGHSDGTLVRGGPDGLTTPIACGISANTVRDTIAIPYGDAQSLSYISRNRDDIAAVLVEPVQSRRPGFQPLAFLAELRELTTNANIALIFDEMITGFRIGKGGAQSWAKIRADIAVYGKIIGGGMPIGVVTARAEYANTLDGGIWTPGGLPPTEPRTFFAGTFCKHPLAMAAAHATLIEIARAGDSMYERLNKETQSLAERLNHTLETLEAPVRVAHFSSLFRLELGVGVRCAPLFYAALAASGVYIWEGRNCFLSTAHSTDDRDLIHRVIESTADRFMKTGLFRGNYIANTLVPGWTGDTHRPEEAVRVNPTDNATVAAAENYHRPIGAAVVTDRNSTAKIVRAIWLSTTGSNCSDDDNFFEAGGDSLLAIELAANIRDELGVKFTVAELFNSPTIRSLTDAVHTKRKSSE